MLRTSVCWRPGEVVLQPIGVVRTLRGMERETGRDEVLWRVAVEGDGEAFGILFDRHRDRLFRHVVRLAESRQDAEDVVATSFLELWRRRRDVRLVNGSVLPWLLVTGTNVSRNLTRGTRRYRRLLARLPRQDGASDPAGVLAEAGRLGLDERLQVALRGLSDVDRQLLTLVVVEGYSLHEAAWQLDLTVSATKSRLHRARARIRATVDHRESRDELSRLGGPR